MKTAVLSFQERLCVLALRSNWLSDQGETSHQIPAKTSAKQGEAPFLVYFRNRMKVNWGQGGVRAGNGYCNFSLS